MGLGGNIYSFCSLIPTYPENNFKYVFLSFKYTCTYIYIYIYTHISTFLHAEIEKILEYVEPERVRHRLSHQSSLELFPFLCDVMLLKTLTG